MGGEKFLMTLALVGATAALACGADSKPDLGTQPGVLPPVSAPTVSAPAPEPSALQPGAPEPGALEPSAAEPSAAEPEATGSAPSQTAPPAPAAGAQQGLPAGAEAIAGIEFLQRIAGTWTGINNASRPLEFQFPMTVTFAPQGESFLYGEFVLSETDNVLWGFNIENYGEGDVLAYRNGGYLAGLFRDSRTQLVEHDREHGYYRFCAVSETGIPVDGCNYIDAQYTFVSDDEMRFNVSTRSGTPHVDWQAHRTERIELPTPFPASVASQGDGSAPWPVDVHHNTE